ncbi:MAG: pitrilysin family protein [Dokdonella sp.]
MKECIIDLPLEHGRFHGLHTATPSVFALTGSFRTAPVLERGELMLQQLVAMLVTCGTRRRDQFEMADLLESRGASLSVESGLCRVSFSARACSDDMPMVVDLLSECLREPRLDAADFVTERTRLIAELQYHGAEPAALASDALSRMLYCPGHPRHQADFAEQVSLIERLTVDDVRRYHREHFGANDLRVVAVGDIDPHAVAAEVDRRLASWLPRLARQVEDPVDPTPEGPQVARMQALGRANFDVALGQRLSIRCDHPDYMALWIANHILGGTFTSRLVSAVREEQGLTYSIRSELARPEREFDGHWQVTLSLSAEKLDAGLVSTRAEIARFVGDGVTAQELAAKRLEAIGAFHIGLATLHGLSETILFGAENGWGPDYIREFAGMVGAVTYDQLNAVIAEHLHPAELQTTIAGPFADEQLRLTDGVAA